MSEYIERESLLVGIGSPESGLDDIINTLIFEHNLDFLHDYDEDEIRVFAKDLISNVRNYIQTEPTADVVEVVRCGQCKNWKINPNNLYGGQCRFSECASIDHFCSRGERKERKDGAKNG